MKQVIKNLSWIEELLPPELVPTPKQGGVGYYRDMILVLILFEHKENIYEHKGRTYPFDLWKGCVFPIEQKKQNAFFLKYVFLENHPANKNWLFISASSENFEEEVKQMLVEIAKQNPLLGLEMKQSVGANEKKYVDIQRRTLKKAKFDKKGENAFLLSMAQRKRGAV